MNDSSKNEQRVLAITSSVDRTFEQEKAQLRLVSDYSGAWGSYVRGSLHSAVATPRNRPNAEKPAPRSNRSATRF